MVIPADSLDRVLDEAAKVEAEDDEADEQIRQESGTAININEGPRRT